ncbi:MAG TPA: outer membrane protein assembly factor BamD [Gammaproteobacteria bacterium]|nr:outer membrane protein assembly factor BamD [Gammaproteobacteria bacterium]
MKCVARCLKVPVLLLLAVLTTFFLAGCSTAIDPAEAYKGESAEQIFQKGEKELRDHNYSEAIKRFEALDVQYPYEKNTETAQLHIIYAYYMTSDYTSTESAANRFIHAHPTSPHVDYAYYMRGLANYFQNMGVFEKLFAVDLATRDLSQVKKSYADFSEVVKTYPNSYYAPAAHQYMVYLRNMLANHELEVAQYYYSREAYVAAADRANLVVREYQGAPAVVPALKIMMNSYHALHLVQPENDVRRVMEYNMRR